MKHTCESKKQLPMTAQRPCTALLLSRAPSSALLPCPRPHMRDSIHQILSPFHRSSSGLYISASGTMLETQPALRTHRQLRHTIQSSSLRSQPFAHTQTGDTRDFLCITHWLSGPSSMRMFLLVDATTMCKQAPASFSSPQKESEIL